MESFRLSFAFLSHTRKFSFPNQSEWTHLEETKLLLITVLILKAEHVLVFAELWPKWLYNGKDEAGHSFLLRVLMCCWVRCAKQNFTVKFRPLIVCFICNYSATGALQFSLHYLWVWKAKLKCETLSTCELCTLWHMGHAPHPTQSLVNSCEEFYQAKQLFSLTQGNWHVLAQLQKVSTVPKCKNILRIAKKKLQGGQSSNKICSLLHGRINLCSQAHSRQAHLPQVCICEYSVWRAPTDIPRNTGTQKHHSSVDCRQFAPPEDPIQSTYKIRLEGCVPL